MKHILIFGFLAAALLPAQTAGPAESLSAWPYYKEAPVSTATSGLAQIQLDGQTLDKSAANQSDLRLYSSAGREIPYVLRVRHAVEQRNEFVPHQFNQAVEGSTAVVSCDLGVQPAEHNVVEIATAGENFRRMAEVEGSSDGISWSTLRSQAVLFRFAAYGRTVEQQTVSYPVSRYRYLRVKVSRDPQVDIAAPEIRELRVHRSIQVQGELVTFSASSMGRDADRMDGRPVSIWRLDLGERLPFEQLVLGISSGAFSRPFQLEIVDDPAAPVLIASGDLTRHADSVDATMSIDFAERTGRHLKLTVIDDRNPPLAIATFSVVSAARQLIFEAAAAGAGPVRLYYGNPKAMPPHYDLAAKLPASYPSPVHPPLGMQHDNPIYRPEPKPFTERQPWLIYAVLIAACVALAGMLLNIARAAKRLPAGS